MDEAIARAKELREAFQARVEQERVAKEAAEAKAAKEAKENGATEREAAKLAGEAAAKAGAGNPAGLIFP